MTAKITSEYYLALRQLQRKSRTQKYDSLRKNSFKAKFKKY